MHKFKWERMTKEWSSGFGDSIGCEEIDLGFMDEHDDL